jgi:uncharacterized membrane protein YbhN (UPF0104 family)
MTDMFPRRIVVRVLVAAAFVLIAGLVCASWPTIEVMLSTAQWWRLTLAIVALALANLGMAMVFMALVLRTSKSAMAGAGIAGSFLVSQVAKYIPGRIWGVAMQVAILRAPGSTSTILAANLELAIVNTATISGIGIAFLAWQRFGPAPAIALLFATWGLGGWLLSFDGIRRFAALVVRLLPRLAQSLAGFSGAGDAWQKERRRPMYGGLLLFLVMYCFGWWLLVSATTHLDGQASMGVVAALSLSYIVGVASMLPAGIGAREGALVLLAPAFGVPHVDMAALAVASRAAMILMDGIAAGIGAMLLKMTAGGEHA